MPEIDLVQASQTEEVSASTVPIISEGRFAEIRWPNSVLFRGRFWRPADASHGLISVPVNPLAVIRPDEAGFPHSGNLGYKAIIDGASPNSFLHIHLMPDLRNFDERRFHKYARKNVKRAIADPDIKVIKITPENAGSFLDQFANLLATSSSVQEYSTDNPSSEAFNLGLVQAGFYQGELLVLAGLVKDQLAAYVTGVAVSNTAIAEMLVIGDRFQDTNVGSRILYSLIQACQRTSGIDQIYNWRVEPTKPGLSTYKERMGFAATAVPMNTVLRPGLDVLFQIVRKIKPAMYYQLYGKY